MKTSVTYGAYRTESRGLLERTYDRLRKRSYRNTALREGRYLTHERYVAGVRDALNELAKEGW